MKKNICRIVYSIVVWSVLVSLSGSCKKDDNDPDPAPATVTDIDGNVYQTITIGTQVWMVENLQVTRYNDGTSIPLVTDDIPWYHLRTPGYCWYNNDISNKNTHGALYNWYTVNTGKLAPTGWHVPTDAEWTTLSNFLGGALEASNKIREAGTTHWLAPNTGATNSSGFTALPAGQRRGDNVFSGVFDSEGYSAYWWSSTIQCCDESYYRTVSPDNSFGLLQAAWSSYSGYSVRCVMD